MKRNSARLPYICQMYVTDAWMRQSALLQFLQPQKHVISLRKKSPQYKRSIEGLSIHLTDRHKNYLKEENTFDDTEA